MKRLSKLKKTLIISVVMLAGLIGVGSANQLKPNTNSAANTPTAAQKASTDATRQDTINPIKTAPADTSPTSNNTLSNNNTYTNVDGNTVHSPAYSSNGSVPIGATAQYVDGTYSFSQHRSGTCSYHGGVAIWY
jgi:hypothetical protein